MQYGGEDCGFNVDIRNNLNEDFLKNWLNDGSYYWHAFQQKDLSGHNLDALFDLANNTYDSDSG